MTLVACQQKNGVTIRPWAKPPEHPCRAGELNLVWGRLEELPGSHAGSGRSGEPRERFRVCLTSDDGVIHRLHRLTQIGENAWNLCSEPHEPGSAVVVSVSSVKSVDIFELGLRPDPTIPGSRVPVEKIFKTPHPPQPNNGSP